MCMGGSSRCGGHYALFGTGQLRDTHAKCGESDGGGGAGDGGDGDDDDDGQQQQQQQDLSVLLARESSSSGRLLSAEFSRGPTHPPPT